MDQEVELRHLRYFVAVAEELHFGRAAKRLHLSQPPLSQQIRQLEEIVGHALLVRTSRSVRLTEAGKVFLTRASRTLRNVERDLEEARSVGQGRGGSLHIGFVSSAMFTTLPTILRAYHQTYPRVQLHLHECFTAQVVGGLENGTLDVGILRDGDEAETLEVTTLSHEPYVAVLPAAHPRAGQRTVAPQTLRGEPFVFYPQSAGRRAFEKPLTLFEAHGFRPQIVQEASHWLTILRLVGAGLGVTVAPACVRSVATPEVVCLPLRGPRIVSQIELAWAAGDTRPNVTGFARVAAAARRA